MPNGKPGPVVRARWKAAPIKRKPSGLPKNEYDLYNTGNVILMALWLLASYMPLNCPIKVTQRADRIFWPRAEVKCSHVRGKPWEVKRDYLALIIDKSKTGYQK